MTVHSKRGLFLDLDGTLANSLEAMREVYNRFLEEYGCLGSVAEFEALNGPSVPEIVAFLKRRHSLGPSATVLADRYDQLVLDAYRNVPVMPGACGAMAAAESRGWAIAVVTSNSGAIARQWLNETGLKKHVTAVAGRETASRGKPEPDLYLQALELAGCAAHRSIAVEDSLAGAYAALGAGIRTYLVGARLGVPARRNLGNVEDLNVLAGWFADGTIDLQDCWATG